MDPTGPGTGPDPESDLTATERRLAGLRPSPVALDRDHLLFEAGRASALAERQGRLAPAMAAVLALIALGLGGLLARERSERKLPGLTLTARPRETSPPPRPPEPVRPLEPDSYLALSRRLLAGHLDPPPVLRQAADPTIKSTTPALAPLRVRGTVGQVEL